MRKTSIKKLVVTSETVRVLGNELERVKGAEAKVDTSTQNLCTLSAKFSYCYSICVNGSDCVVE